MHTHGHNESYLDAVNRTFTWIPNLSSLGNQLDWSRYDTGSSAM